MAADLPALTPVRDPGATLTDLLEVVLNKGVVLHLDLLISVADIPLVGVSVRAALAGMETMLSHGLLNQWDAQTREWIQRSVSRDVPLEKGEVVRARMRASVEEMKPHRGWRPGLLFLTDRRVLLFRGEPRAVLLDLPLGNILGVTSERRATAGDGTREVLVLQTASGSHPLLAQEPDALRDLLPVKPSLLPAPPPVPKGRLWYREPRSVGSVWRAGEASWAQDALHWRATTEERPSVRVAVEEIVSMQMEPDHPVAGPVLCIRHTRGELRIGGDIAPWVALVRHSLEARS